jgi:NAD(P)-dependent dehydrogenase (short-subunit alcohol dehydrogenase family)
VATSRESKHVVNVSFALACIPRATEPAYVATKAGLIALSQSGRADWGGFGVGVSVVCPRVTNTAIAEHAVEGEETMGDTTWGGWHVTGTFDGQRFRLTEPPGPSQPGDDVDGGSDFRPPVDKPNVVDASEGGAEWDPDRRSVRPPGSCCRLGVSPGG